MLNSSLNANGKNFYFDYQSGKFGYNENAARGAGTFHPFDSAIMKCWLSFDNSTYGTHFLTYIKEDDTFVQVPTWSGADYSKFNNVSEEFYGYAYQYQAASIMKCKKAGYYLGSLGGLSLTQPVYLANNQQISSGDTGFYIYLGTTNPFN